MKLKDKVQYALDESRMLVLGIQVLLGFTFDSFFMSKLHALPPSARVLQLASLAMLLAATTLLMAPVARHRIVDRGRDTPHLHAFTRRATELALLPFALSLGVDFYIVGYRVHGAMVGTVAASAASTLALAAWYAVPWAARRHKHFAEDRMEPTKLNDKIRHVLTEARVVLPGTQALLGFQFTAVLQSGFDELPASSKIVHLVGLGFLGASVILLMLPAAYHRIAEEGDISERLHRFSSGCILGSMVALSGGLASSTFVVVRKATDSLRWALASSMLWLLVSSVVWFGMMLVVRARRARGAGRAVPSY